MKRIVVLITLVTLMASQALGAALCPSVCESLNTKPVETQTASCHQEEQGEPASQEMPDDCEIMVMIDTFSVFQVTSHSVELSRANLILDFTANSVRDYVTHLVASTNLNFTLGKSPPVGTQPIYLLNQNFRI